ncbi:hypothetical protein KFK09_016145 [Dendrobium nobile]|uniref:Uncharacterized protein n=1 Tax=Dendrobium nobile TaxID=94219 RepID=A0A8T3AZW9_DENNO|nr:hypothetical protein KFK09_016145 [Dendrobium nobile]
METSPTKRSGAVRTRSSSLTCSPTWEQEGEEEARPAPQLEAATGSSKGVDWEIRSSNACERGKKRAKEGREQVRTM